MSKLKVLLNREKLSKSLLKIKKYRNKYIAL
jgi:hypothetical protein